MRPFQNLNLFASAMIAIALLCTNCAPVFSDLQSARTVGENNIEATPSYSSVNYGEDGESEKLQNHFGLQLAYGLTEKVDIRARYERIWFKDGEISDGIDIIGLGPKFSIVPDRLALFVPIGRAVGEDTEDTWEVQPTILATFSPIENQVDITLAPKVIIPLCSQCETMAAVNIGAAFGKDVRRLSIRPEYGILFRPGESGHYSQFSIGVSAMLSKN